MQVNANVRNRNGTFGRCQQLESDVDMAEEAELQRLAGRRAPIPAVRAATDASAATGVWYVPANPVGPRTAAEGEGEGSAEAREGIPSGSNTDPVAPDERRSTIPQHIGVRETAPTIPQPSATRGTDQEANPRYESLFLAQVQTRSANTDVAVVVAVAVAAAWTPNASAHAASSAHTAWQVEAEKKGLLEQFNTMTKAYRTHFRAYAVYHKTKYGVDHPSIEALGERWAFLPLLTMAQAIEFFEAYAFDKKPFGQATWNKVHAS